MSRWCRSLHALMRLHCHGELTMSQDHLGLFDTPPNRRETRLSLALVALIFAAFLLILPFRDVSLGQLNAFIPAADAVMFVAELVTATLLYGQAAIFRSRALRLLATCYVFSAFLLIPHALAFPDAFAPDGLLGGGLKYAIIDRERAQGRLPGCNPGLCPAQIGRHGGPTRRETAGRLDQPASPCGGHAGGRNHNARHNWSRMAPPLLS